MGINELLSMRVLLGFDGTNRWSSLGVLLDLDVYKRIFESGSFVGFQWVQTGGRVREFC